MQQIDRLYPKGTPIPIENASFEMLNTDAIAGGTRNPTLITSQIMDGKKVVARIFNAGEECFGFNRTNEAKLFMAAAEVGVAPPVLLYTGNGIVTEFIDGEKISGPQIFSDKYRALVIRSIVNLHKINIALEPFDPLPGFWSTVSASERDGVLIPYKDQLIDTIQILKERIHRCSKNNLCASHNDLLGRNMIGTPDNVWFVDYEYAGEAPDLYDIAKLTSAEGLSTDESITFASDYRKGMGNHLNSDDIDDLQIFRMVASARSMIMLNYSLSSRPNHPEIISRLDQRITQWKSITKDLSLGSEQSWAKQLQEKVVPQI